ncbi:D-2-hydroxyacid dehydrogenase [Streptomyces winkii]|uniref:D-2-hydroxyacid dehydrogenase n=1 Tax=Streptomyces winkii TaxID=3051178 RepID=UPI0028D2E539|nr:D-2-hydroxyacid dehydrogenase [Streptomyces sp. DSM 40971]
MNRTMVDVLIKSWLEPEHVERIRESDPRVRVLYDTEMLPPPQGRRRLLYREESLPEPRDFSRTPEQERAWQEQLAQAEVILDIHLDDLDTLQASAPGLRWLQAGAAGAGEAVAGTGLLEAGVTVTTGSGIFSGPLAEFTVAAILAHVKDLDRLGRQRRERYWHTAATGTLKDKTVCIVGMGSIGEEVARCLHPFGCRLTGVRRSVTGRGTALGRGTGRGSENTWLLSSVHPAEGLAEAVAEADYVVVTLPATPQTHHLFDAPLIKAMKPGSYVVNVGRGAVIDEPALIAALGSGHLSGAALDVTETEPLPVDSPLWDLPNVLLGYHATAMTTGGTANKLLTDIFCDNLRRYLDGRPLRNQVDPAHLY